MRLVLFSNLPRRPPTDPCNLAQAGLVRVTPGVCLVCAFVCLRLFVYCVCACVLVYAFVRACVCMFVSVCFCVSVFVTVILI